MPGTRGVRNDHPNILVRREQVVTLEVTSAGTSGRFMNFQKARLLAVHVQNSTKGTHANNSYTFRKVEAGATTILGTFALGTNNINLNTSLTFGSGDGTIVASKTRFEFVKGAEATGVSVATYEWEVTTDAVMTSDR